MEQTHPIQWCHSRTHMEEDEVLEPLTTQGAAILQKRYGFRFGTDAVALAGFTMANLTRGRGRRGVKKVADLGTGTGILALLLALDTEIPSFSCLEIQPEMADMAFRSVEGNGLEGRITVHHADLRSATTLLGHGSMDLVVSNPPHMPVGAALKNESPSSHLARHEVLCTLKDVVREASGLLRPGGSFCMVHRTDRLTDVLAQMRMFGLEPKQLQPVVNRLLDAPAIFLVRGLRGGRPGLRWLPPRQVGHQSDMEAMRMKDDKADTNTSEQRTNQ